MTVRRVAAPLLALLAPLAGCVEDPCGAADRWRDGDGDGFGDRTQPALACPDEPGFADNPDDCDDHSDQVHPGALERCDAQDLDEDCDGLADDADPDVASDSTTWYTDLDGDGFGDDTTAEARCDAPADAVAEAGDCDDADDATYPGAPEACGEGDHDCDGRATSCLTLNDATGVLVGGQPGDGLGDVVGVGDLDQDGHGELAVTAPGSDLAEPDRGATWLWLGAPDQREDASRGPLAWSRAGEGTNGVTHAVWLGDVTGDGVTDWGVAAVDAAWVCDGRESAGGAGLTLLGMPDLVRGESDGGRWTVAGVGDLNGDGVDDVAEGSEGSGVVVLTWGGRFGEADEEHDRRGDPDRRLYGDSGTLFGHTLGSAGDTDGDGWDELLIGESCGGGSCSAGAVYLVGGPLDADVSAEAVARAVFEGEATSGTVDLHLDARRGGDWDGDGLADVLVGVDQAGGQSDQGGVYVYTGAPEGRRHFADAPVHLERSGPGDGLSSLAWIGDLDGDHRDDLLVGAAGTGPSGGVGWLRLGGAVGTSTLSDTPWALSGAEAGDRLGAAVAGLGDVDGGGVPDFAVGAPSMSPGGESAAGAVFFFRGEELR